MPSNKSWFETWFNHPLYLSVYAHRNMEDAEQLMEHTLPLLNLPFGATITDLGCGAGRHAVLFAKKGFSVTGVDLSQFLLEKGKSLAVSEYVKVNFIHSDMRFYRSEIPSDLVTNLFTSFGYFEDDRENFSIFKTVHDILKPRGWFLFDYLNPTYLHRNLIAESNDQIDHYEINQKRWVEHDAVHKLVNISHEKNGQFEFKEYVKLYPYDLITSVLKNFGLTIKHSLGTYDGKEFHQEESPRMIILAQRE